MTIDISNAETINTKSINFHDDVLLSLKFDRETKMMELEIKKHTDSHAVSMKFINVAVFSMTACDFWGESERICGFDYLKTEDRKLLPQLKYEWDNSPHIETSFLYDDYMEVVMVFISGDKLRILCKKIEID